MKYKIQKRHLDGVSGDPTWLYPRYSYHDFGDIETDAPIQKGDQVYDKKVIEVKHENKESIVVIGD